MTAVNDVNAKTPCLFRTQGMLSLCFAKHIKDKAVVIAFKQLRNRKYINYKQNLHAKIFII